ncbi:MAG: phosphopyruvate hydratase, partial [Betaproteobacteria bacterium]|nr:phosphopyruvate hydratase [Betaproteobacteria bacterium]
MATIVDLRGRKVWDSRGRATVEAQITLKNGKQGRAIAPAGASTGAGEARSIEVAKAVAAINGRIRTALIGSDPRDQATLDARLVKLDGTAERSRLGGNAIVAVSLACAQAAAAAAR